MVGEGVIRVENDFVPIFSPVVAVMIDLAGAERGIAKFADVIVQAKAAADRATANKAAADLTALRARVERLKNNLALARPTQ